MRPIKVVESTEKKARVAYLEVVEDIFDAAKDLLNEAFCVVPGVSEEVALEDVVEIERLCALAKVHLHTVDVCANLAADIRGKNNAPT